MTLASVVIPSRGGAGRLPRLLSALAAQDDPGWEAIVVVDGDIDHSARVIEQYAHLPVRSIIFPQNRGRVAALNAGFDAATGEILIRCDDDMEPFPDWISQHKKIHAHQRVGAIGLPLNISPDTAYWRAYGSVVDQKFRDGAYATDLDDQWRYWGGNVSMTRQTWQRVGPYSDAYRGYGFEDVDMGYLLHAAGIEVRLFPELHIRHHMAAVTTVIRARRAYHSGAARRIFEARHGQHVLGDPLHVTPSLWNRLVGGLSHFPLSGITAVARAADLLAAVLPGPVAHKVIAMVVEGAGMAGSRSARDVSTRKES